MTRDELRKKYKDAPNREDMTIEQERELVSDLFDAYEQEGFAPESRQRLSPVLRETFYRCGTHAGI